MTLLDSSIVLAFLSPNDNQHEKAKKLLVSLSGFVLSDYVLSETVTVLRNRQDEQSVTRLIDQALSNDAIRLIHLSPPVFITCLRLFADRRHPKLSFVDTTLLLLSRQYDVLTFDRALSRAIAADQKRGRLEK